MRVQVRSPSGTIFGHLDIDKDEVEEGSDYTFTDEDGILNVCSIRRYLRPEPAGLALVAASEKMAQLIPGFIPLSITQQEGN